MGVSYPSHDPDVKPQQEPHASSKAPNQDLRDMDVLCTFKIKIESKNSDNGCIKYQWLYPNQDQDAKLQSGTFSVLQSPKWWLKGHGCSLHLQNQDWEPKFVIWVNQRSVTISKLTSGCKTPVRSLQHPPEPQTRTWRTWMFFASSKSRDGAKIWNIGVPKTSDHIQIKIKMPNPSQEPPASSKAPNQD